ncbi:MAG: hydantoinase/oxoprolinase family protein [Desulfarculaceae bacterium]|jgi:N-methylhydantoinase A
MKYKIGIDVGGTFTDFLLTMEDGSSEIYKVLSTPQDPSIATMKGIGEMAEARGLSLGDFLGQVTTIVHGTTVTTNAVLTLRGAKTGLITTEGVRDALEMRRGIREEQYNNRYTNVEPVVPRYLRRPVKGRLDYAGQEIEVLNTDEIAAACALFKDEGVEAVAICFMNSFANPVHEEQALAMVAELMPEAYQSVSTRVIPSIRFYDRVSTTCLNAFVGPILRDYLDSLVRKLDQAQYQGVLLIMQSNGGVVRPEAATSNAATTLLSGPAGGPVAGIAYGQVHDQLDLITVDMGGTSFDAALVKDGKPLVTTEGEIDHRRIALPMLNVVTIGAGGGSIGWIDEGGLLRMGPQSAGSSPGPACYGLGGELPACTDADLVLGYLSPRFFAGGKMPLDMDKARKAIKTQVADPMGYSIEEAAAGMYQVINVNMATAVREVAVKQGADPRDFPLVVAGGAGPNHACMIALELEIPLLLVPRESSIFCAAGMLMSDLQHDFVRTYPCLLKDIDIARFKQYLEDMRSEGVDLLASEGIPKDRVQTFYSLDLRYLKQYHEVNVPVEWEEVEKGDIAAMEARFHPAHNALCGYELSDLGTAVELINMRVRTIGVTEKPRFKKEAYFGEDASSALKGNRNAYVPKDGEFSQVPVYDGAGLKHGMQISGPAIVEQVNTSTFITPEYRMVVDSYGSMAIYLPSKEDEVLRRIEK